MATVRAVLPSASQAKRKTADPVVVYLPCRKGEGLLCIEVGSKDTLYIVTETPIDPRFGSGRGFKLTKETRDFDIPNTEHYCVYVGGGNSTCDCRGFERYGRCKHTQAMCHLVQTGQIDQEDADHPQVKEEPVKPKTAFRFPLMVEAPKTVQAVTIVCPVCGEIATAVPTPTGRAQYKLVCKECEQWSEHGHGDFSE